MTSRPPAPPLPKPEHPSPSRKGPGRSCLRRRPRLGATPGAGAGDNRAISQLYSTLRDLGIATRGLARYRTAGASPDPASQDFSRHVTASAPMAAQRVREPRRRTGGRGHSAGSPDPDEPGAALCQAARNAIVAWRQPSGTSADRDITVKRFITATGFLSSATLGLAAYAPRRRSMDLQVAGASLAEVIAYLTAAIQAPAGNAAAGDVRGPARYQGGAE